MFLSTDTPFRAGTALPLRLALPTGRSATLGARVVHVLAAEPARCFWLMASIGVQFERLDEQAEAVRARAGRLAPTNGAGPRVARIMSGAAVSAVQHDPILSFLLGYVDGRRDLEALARELALEVDAIERALGVSSSASGASSKSPCCQLHCGMRGPAPE